MSDEGQNDRRGGALPMRLYDGIPVVELPDGRRALIDTGWTGPDVVTNDDVGPVTLGETTAESTRVAVDLGGIATRVGAPRVDLLVGAGLLHQGFTIDFEADEFLLASHRLGEADELIAELPYTKLELGDRSPPVLPVYLNGQPVSGLFDTGAPYCLWKTAPPSSHEHAVPTRRDFHIDQDGRIVDFDVHMRSELLALPGLAPIEIDVAFLPPSMSLDPHLCVLGMNLPPLLKCDVLVLDPVAMALRFERRSCQRRG